MIELDQKLALILLYLILCFFACSPSYFKIIELQVPKSTIPEGIVVHPTTKEIYISSIHENELTKSTPNGKGYEVVLNEATNGYSQRRKEGSGNLQAKEPQSGWDASDFDYQTK